MNIQKRGGEYHVLLTRDEAVEFGLAYQNDEFATAGIVDEIGEHLRDQLICCECGEELDSQGDCENEDCVENPDYADADEDDDLPFANPEE